MRGAVMESNNSVLNVSLKDREYPIYIGWGGLADSRYFKKNIKSKNVLIVSNDTVAPLYLEQLRFALKGYSCSSVILPDGEKYKTLEYVSLIFDTLLARGYSRDCTIIALGGGVVGDMAGFAAACFQRGVSLVQVPTTLLSQVDSSVGGKTGVNHPMGKNMIGAFHQPKCVVIDINVLRTLPDKEFRSGVAEIIKYGLICDAKFFSWLERNIGALIERDDEVLKYAIEKSCQIKSNIVSHDELEHGRRGLLNLGHTFGHGLEAAMGYGNLLHGEGVAIGTCMAANISCMLETLSDPDRQRVYALFSAAGLPTKCPPGVNLADVITYMQSDKKVNASGLRLVLMDGIGDSYITADYDSDMLSTAMAA